MVAIQSHEGQPARQGPCPQGLRSPWETVKAREGSAGGTMAANWSGCLVPS